MVQRKTDSLKPRDSADVVPFVDDILRKAFDVGASDIHFEPTVSDLTIKFRLDGVLDNVEHLPKAFADNVIARLKVLGGLLTYRNDIPQEGRIAIGPELADRLFDQRLAIFPTIHGQRAVVRVFYKNLELTQIDHLGFAGEALSQLKSLTIQNQGMILVTGPAGSGKSTTLAAMLRYLLKECPGKSIVSLEDPVEIAIDGVTQVQITPYGQMTFPTALRSLLRQDPQVLMIGEIRDAETARIAVEAGLTGHLLLSTMHSGTPAAALLRLLEMGIEPYQVTSSVIAVLNQRLIRRLCTHCKTVDKSGTHQSVGCEKCLNTGFHGRMLISELVQIDSQLRKALVAKSDAENIDKLLSERGHRTILDDGKRLINQGITTPAEIAKSCGLPVEQIMEQSI